MYGKRWGKALFVMLTFISSVCYADVIKIAMIDSGVKLEQNKNVKFCPSGHYNFINNKVQIGRDLRDHGTNIAQTIADFAKDTNYCIIVYKIFGAIDGGDETFIAKAVDMAVKEKVTIINMSLSSSSFKKNAFSQIEHDAIKKAIAAGIKVFAAAGNDNQDLDKHCYAFPVCYTDLHIIIVGSKKDNDNLSNYGNIVSITEDYKYKDTLGTSISTAIATGKYIRILK